MMKFGAVPILDAKGHLLAHSLVVGDLRISKGTKLDEGHIQALKAAEIETVTVAALEDDDVEENAAAEMIGESIPLQNIHILPPVSGRVNFYANDDGVLNYDTSRLVAANLVDEGISLALLAPKMMVKAGQLLGTLKIIPYAVSHKNIHAVSTALQDLKLAVATYPKCKSTLILTVNDGLKPSLVKKGERAVRDRLALLQQSIDKVKIVPHDVAAVSAALQNDDAEMIYILTAAATSDRADIAPSAVVKSGGTLRRYGIPVDPGNLLFWARRSVNGATQNIIGLPGCVRAPAINGADFVVARVLTGGDLSVEDFAAMGIGGLLKENVTRPKPRIVKDAVAPKIALLLLAAGASSRMNGEDKLTKDIDGMPLLARVTENLKCASVDGHYAVVSEHFPKRARILAPEGYTLFTNPAPENGLGSSLGIGVRQIARDYDAVVVALGDMPEITASDIDRLIAVYQGTDSVEICRAATEDGKGGHPVLFSRRFFEDLQQIDGDIGARELMKRAAPFVKNVSIAGNAARIDLDTQEDFTSYQAHGQKISNLD